MALPVYINTTEIIRALDDEPNDVGGLTADQLKAKFDQFADEIVEFITDEYSPAIENLVVDNGTDYTTARARNIVLSTSDPSGGGNGDVWIKYTP